MQQKTKSTLILAQCKKGPKKGHSTLVSTHQGRTMSSLLALTDRSKHSSARSTGYSEPDIACSLDQEA
jgi:hypothetical protein